jgi:hypothetical protein
MASPPPIYRIKTPMFQVLMVCRTLYLRLGPFYKWFLVKTSHRGSNGLWWRDRGIRTCHLCLFGPLDPPGVAQVLQIFYSKKNLHGKKS